jgi:hypothetical protein
VDGANRLSPYVSGPTCLNEFRRMIDAQIIPLLSEQPGFKDLITFDIEIGEKVVVQHAPR